MCIGRNIVYFLNAEFRSPQDFTHLECIMGLDLRKKRKKLLPSSGSSVPIWRPRVPDDLLRRHCDVDKGTALFCSATHAGTTVAQEL